MRPKLAQPESEKHVHKPLNHEVETYTGQFVNVAAPEPQTIALSDIAHALAATCRYGGHCRNFYSVAEHAVLCAWYVQRKWGDPISALAALHHDDPEYVLGDIPRPIKSLLGPAYGELTQQMEYAIAVGLDLPLGAADLHTDRVREADNWALLVEAKELLPSKGEGWGGQECNWDLTLEQGPIDPPDDFAFGLRPNAAEGLYIAEHRRLLKEIG